MSKNKHIDVQLRATAAKAANTLQAYFDARYPASLEVGTASRVAWQRFERRKMVARSNLHTFAKALEACGEPVLAQEVLDMRRGLDAGFAASWWIGRLANIGQRLPAVPPGCTCNEPGYNMPCDVH